MLLQVMFFFLILAFLLAGGIQLVGRFLHYEKLLELKTTQVSLLKHYTFLASLQGTRNQTVNATINTDLRGHFDGSNPKIGAQLTLTSVNTTIKPTPIYNVSIYNSSGVRLIPSIGLRLKQNGDLCNATCIASNMDTWVITPKWLAQPGNKFNLYIEVNLSRNSLFLPLKDRWKTTFQF